MLRVLFIAAVAQGGHRAGVKSPPDLSLLLRLPDQHFVIVDSVGDYFVCCVSVIDLDPKRFDKIPFYLTEEKAVLASYREHTTSL